MLVARTPRRLHGVADGDEYDTEFSSQRRQGAVALPSGEVSWRVWAPKARAVDLILVDGDQRRALPMRGEDGYFCRVEGETPEGQRYAYRIDGGPERPDPASLWQRDGVHGPSAFFRPEAFSWGDKGWKGVRREDLVFYELHVGTFTREGTFGAIIPRLRELKEMGVTAIELMPVAQFPGSRNWGYDGVLPYAAQDSYGGPRGLQELVDACHRAGLAVFLDVVYNHFGPEGNYLREFGPYFTDRYQTPWGSAVNFDGPGCDAVRDYVLDNARMWLDEFHLDGLRLDAVHAIYDMGARPILRAIAEVGEEAARKTGRPVHVIGESGLNDPRLLLPPERGGHGLSGQWADDFHHALHVHLTGERRGYYTDYGGARDLARVLESPFLFAWDYSPSRGRKHGAPPEGLAGDRFVVCIQNHDQVGNRPRGERLGSLVGSPAKQRLAASLLLLSPHLPLIFMGEEYGEDAPFPFFCSFSDPQLQQAVREGREREFAEFAEAGVLPDPLDESTFDSARLSWSWPEGTPRAGLRRLYADLLAARREWPALRDFERRSARLLPDEESGPVLLVVRGVSAMVVANLSETIQLLPPEAAQGGEILFRSESIRYGGAARDGGPRAELAPFEVVVFGPPSWRSF
jgi:maltooligosyltrehalose trehalohydrolase